MNPMAAIIRSLFPRSRGAEIERLSKVVSEQEGHITAELTRIAETPDPYGEKDAFGSFVHALRGDQQRRNAASGR